MPTPLEIAAEQTQVFIDQVDVAAKELVIEQAARQGITLDIHDMDWAEIGIGAGCGKLMEMLHERGWLNGQKMVVDMLAEANRR